jgi:hypothetical protein
MPNLLQIQGLREKYNSKSRVNTREIKALSESFNKSSYDIKHSFSFQGLDQNIVRYFEEQRSADVIILFIDITNFSEKSKQLNNSELSNYLDEFYDKTIPLIYAQGGEIEKILGDGIICLFGEPFLDNTKSELFEKADKTAKDIIVELKDSDKEVKIALHDGYIMYYKQKNQNYQEYTMIGKPLTELFRLESIAENNSINFYTVSDYDKLEISKDGVYRRSDRNQHSSWKKSNRIEVNLKGVDWSGVKNFCCSYKTE